MILENAAKRGVVVDVVVAGAGSPIFLSKLPWRRLSRAFCTVGSLSSGDGPTPAGVLVVVVIGVDVLVAIDITTCHNLFLFVFTFFSRIHKTEFKL